MTLNVGFILRILWLVQLFIRSALKMQRTLDTIIVLTKQVNNLNQPYYKMISKEIRRTEQDGMNIHANPSLNNVRITAQPEMGKSLI